MYEIIFRERSNNVSGLREKRMKRRFITFLLDFYNTIQCSRVKNLEFLIREMLENGIQKVENGKPQVSNLANEIWNLNN